MRDRLSSSMLTVAIATAAAGALVSVPVTRASAQAPAASVTPPAPALTTPWGEPDLQGIWTDETDTPLQRSPRYASQEFFTAAQRGELDRERSALLRRDRRGGTGAGADVAGGYNALVFFLKHTGGGTSVS